MKFLVIYNHPLFTLLTALILSLMLVALLVNYPMCRYSVDTTTKVVYCSVSFIFFIKEVVKVIINHKK
jgi:hypothetical protein